MLAWGFVCLLCPHKIGNRAELVPCLLSAHRTVSGWERMLSEFVGPASPLTESFCASVSWPVK